jgi:5'-3' exonuclease/20S proteasome alpha/beta subunit
MGVPKFFRWLSERYTKVNQRVGRVSNPATVQEHYGDGWNAAVDVISTSSSTSSSTSLAPGLPTPHAQNNVHHQCPPDPLSTCSAVPPIDRLYIDMNGIIHGGSHNNQSQSEDDDGATPEIVVGISEAEIFANICFYLDRIVRDICQPQQLVYMAIDGVAPRAKLNQQRSRRYRSGKEGLIEQTIYDAHLKQLLEQQEEDGVLGALANDDDVHLKASSASSSSSAPSFNTIHTSSSSSFTNATPGKSKGGSLWMETTEERHDHAASPKLREIEPGRFAGKFLAHLDDLGVGQSTTATTTTTAPSSWDGISRIIIGDAAGSSAPRHDGEQFYSEAEYQDHDFIVDEQDGGEMATGNTTAAGGPEHVFHSNSITPGTPFFDRCTQHILHFLQRKISDDPAWQHLTVVFSGPNVPGEGEHKILQFMREQKAHYEQQSQLPQPTEPHALSYHPNLRHCIMGQDGDLIMLGLLTHEPNLCLLREQVKFDMKAKADIAPPQSAASALQSYVHNPNFELLHMNVLRDYFSYEFETSNVLPDSSQWCLEHCIDDFVFMTFFVGNDFLPHMPAVDIADEAFDLLFYTYRHQRKKWLKEKGGKIPYLTDRGTIVSGKRLEQFLQVLGKHETPYLEYKKSTDDTEKARQLEAKYGMNTIPTDEARAAKEAADRALFRERIVQTVQDDDDENDETEDAKDSHEEVDVMDHYPNFRPVLSAAGVRAVDDEEVDAEALSERMGGLLRYSVGGEDVHISEEDLKGRYYSDKFGFSPFDAEKHLALRKSYIEGLVWNLKYYYEGCVSWEWFYPYHYGPMLSDLVGIDAMLNEISFEGKLGKPLRPFEQLMACMPPSHAEVLPEPYRAFMTDPNSVISDFYPQSFTIDMNGKRWPWEAVVLLPFIDSKRLLDTVRQVDERVLTEDERKRNEFGQVAVFSRDPTISYRKEAVGEGRMFGPLPSCSAKCEPFESSPLYIPPLPEKPVFKPMLLEGVEHPLPGFPTLRDGTVAGMWRKLLRVNIHGSRSRYKTACLEIDNPIPDILPVETIAQHLNGTLLWINYPHFVEALVTAVSDSNGVIRGQSSRKAWTEKDAATRKKRLQRLVDNYVFGERLVGTGGITLAGGTEVMENIDILLYVRPFAGLKKLSDGTVAKTYAKFEIEVPLFVTGWAPQREDPRINSLPVWLEKDPYHAAKFVLNDKRPEDLSPAAFSNSDWLPATEKGFMNRLHSAAHFYHTVCDRPGPLALSLNRFSRLKHPRWASLPATGLGSLSSVHQYSLSSNLPGTVPMNASFSSRRQLHHPRGGASTVHRGRLLALGLAASIFSYFIGGTYAMLDGKSLYSSIPAARNDFLPPPTYFSDVEAVISSHPPLTKHEQSAHVPPFQFAHGTTTLAFLFSGGIVVAVDSRASLGGFVGSKTTQKVLPIHSHMVGTMAGGAADCMVWIRKLRCEASYYEAMHEGRRMSVACASRILAHALYNNRQFDLSVGSMIMGFDEDDDSNPSIYYVDNTGLRLRGDCFAVGSGSVLALGILDTERRYDMRRDEAIGLGIKAIRHATLRDAYSGGYINVFLLTAEQGWVRVFAQDIDEMAVAASTLS